MKRDYSREHIYSNNVNSSILTFNQEKTISKNTVLGDRIPKEFEFSQTKEVALMDTYLEIDKAYMMDKKDHLSINDAISGEKVFSLMSSNQKSHVEPEKNH